MRPIIRPALLVRLHRTKSMASRRGSMSSHDFIAIKEAFLSIVHLKPSTFIADSTSSIVMPGRINIPISVCILSGASIFLVLVVAHPSTSRTRRHAIGSPFPIVTHESFHRRTCFYTDQPKPCRPHQCGLSRKLASIRS